MQIKFWVCGFYLSCMDFWMAFFLLGFWIVRVVLSYIGQFLFLVFVCGYFVWAE